MGIITKIEDKLADLVENPFKGKTGFDLMGIEIEVKRLFQARRKNILGKEVVPNHIAIVLNKKEYVEYEPFFEEIRGMLKKSLGKWLKEKGYETFGEIEFDFRQAVLENNVFEIRVSYRKENTHEAARSAGTASSHGIEKGSKEKIKRAIGKLVNCDTGERFGIYPGATVIGRSEDCTVKIDDPTISRKHAFITYQDGKAILEDLGSKSGTRVNHEKVIRKILRHGDKIKIGHTELMFAEMMRKNAT